MYISNFTTTIILFQEQFIHFTMVTMDQYQEDFVFNLKKYRKGKKLSQARLSELCDVATGTISNIECGLSKPSFDLIVRISKVLEINPAQLFSATPVIGNTKKEEIQDQILTKFYTELKSYFNDTTFEENNQQTD